jgi:hypothetical protein
MDTKSILDSLRRFDDSRPSLPGEHWMTLGAGAILLFSGGRGSVLGRLLSIAAGSALIYRAVSGRDGLGQLLRSNAAAADEVPGRHAVVANGRVIASADDAGLDGQEVPEADLEPVEDRRNAGETSAFGDAPRVAHGT